MACRLGSAAEGIAWIGRHELPVLIGLLILVLAVWGFVAIADVVSEGRTQNFDNWVVRALRRPDDPAKPIGPEWMHEVGRDLTALEASPC